MSKEEGVMRDGHDGNDVSVFWPIAAASST